MEQRGASRALPPALSEWQQLDLSSPAWGLRHYRVETMNKDSLSMLVLDPHAKGLVFFGDNKPQPFLIMRYLSGTQDAGNRILDMQRKWLQRFPIRDEHADNLPAWERISTECLESRARVNVLPNEVRGKPFTNLSVDASFFFAMDSMYLPWLGFSRP
jgi:hypothetical protein